MHLAAPTGVMAIRGLNLRIASGEQVAVIGPSGAGKTTLLHVLACAIQPATGELNLAHKHPWQLSAKRLQSLRAQLFLAPQVPPLPPRQRVVTAVSAALLPRMGLWQSMRQLFAPQHAALAQRALAQFDLAGKLFDRVDRLSGGERQRVGLARCVLACESNEAKLLLVDEPLSALDPSLAVQALSAIQRSAAQQQATLVCSLHQVELALQHFPRIVALRDGALVFDAPAQAVSAAMLHDLYSGALPDSSSTSEAHLVDEGSSQNPTPLMQCR